MATSINTMINSIAYKNTLLKYTDRGEGKTIVLLHGYLENIEIWGSFAQVLENEYRIIRIDLLGHGGSGNLGKAHSMSEMAEAVHYVITELNVEQAFVVGHSMGGYAALAYLNNYADRISGLCLFHSSPFADTKEKRHQRDREINLVHAGKKDQLFNAHVPKIFAPENVALMGNTIKSVSKQVGKMGPEGIVAALDGMKQRADLSELLANTQKPVLYIIGDKDQFIPQDILEKIQFPKVHEILHLKNSGHMGMLEETEVVLESFRKFIRKYLQSN